jgi:hypothetical protein
MIAVQLMGGLGNQLFQYSAARSASIRNGVGTLLDVHPFPFDIYGRRFELAHFRINAELRGNPDAPPALVNFPRTRSLMWRVQTKIWPWLRGPVVRQRGFAFDDSLERVRDGSCMLGLFQSERFFVDVADQIREELSLTITPSNTDAAVLGRIQESNAVCVHFRVQRYGLGLTPPEFYARALKYLTSRVSKPTLFVFTDDPVWVRKNVNLGLPMTLVDHNDGRAACRDLRLMAACRHFVIPNSTFSWWGAWLSHSPGKIVVATERWFVGKRHDTRDLLPASWIRL